MKSQVILLEAIIVFILVVTVLILSVPVHQDLSPYIHTVREFDINQVSRLINR